MNWLNSWKQLGAYKKRGILYGIIGVFGLGSELLVRESPRGTILLLWSGLIVIAALVYMSFREPDS